MVAPRERACRTAQRLNEGERLAAFYRCATSAGFQGVAGDRPQS